MNYKSLASKGRYGDSELRNVGGRKSHVNKREASLIDALGRKGQALTQAVGAGTRNPKTGMPEYHNMEGTVSGQTVSLPHDHLPGGEIDFTGQYDKDDLDDPGYSITHEGDVAEIIGNIISKGGYDPKYDFNKDNKIDILDIQGGIAAGEYDQSDYTEFDPTVGGEYIPSKDEFQQFVQSGNIDELIEGFGGDWTEEDFGDIMEMDKLGFLQEGYGLQIGKLESDKTITGGILQDQLTSAKGQYGRGLQAAGYNVGKSLFDVKQQVEGQKSKGGFAGSGFVAATGERAKRGVFQDYRAQQRELSAGLGEAKTAFKWGTDRMESDYQYGMDTARLGLKTDIYDFWSGKYEDFYDRLHWLED
tara:strand:- start:218 stop:1297 length:1080 start_codon:yes stop_codon:yes gene_type:complete